MTSDYDPDIQARKIFVGGLATVTDDRSFMEYFKQYGDITDSIVMYGKGFGFVEFAEVSSIEKCLAACPHTVDGAEVNVKHTEPPTPGKKKGEDDQNCEIHALFPYGTIMDKDTISIYFSQFGEVVSCSIPVNTVLNRPKNFCFIKFDERTAVLKALDKKQHKLGEINIKVTEFEEKNERNKKTVYGPYGKKQEINPHMIQEFYARQSSGRNFYNEPARGSYYDNTYCNWHDDRGYVHFDVPADYVLVKRPKFSQSRMDEAPYRKGREFPMRRGREFEGYDPPQMMGGPMRNHGGPRQRFNPMARPPSNISFGFVDISKSGGSAKNQNK